MKKEAKSNLLWTRRISLYLVLSAAGFVQAEKRPPQNTGPVRVVSDSVKIGNETKKSTGLLTALQSGDVACYLTLKDKNGTPFTEMAIFEICEMQKMVGKRVRLSYRIESVIADSCQGNPECQDTRKVALVSAIRALTPAK